MPISISKPLLVEGGDIFSRYAGETDDMFILICARGLRAIAEQSGAYEVSIQMTAKFMLHLQEELEKLRAYFSGTGKSGVMAHARMQEAAFCLVEDMALVMREKKLRTGCIANCADEEALLAFFEGSGYWRAADGSMVTGAYYVDLPVAVLHNLLRRTENVMQAVV